MTSPRVTASNSACVRWGQPKLSNITLRRRLRLQFLMILLFAGFSLVLPDFCGSSAFGESQHPTDTNSSAMRIQALFEKALACSGREYKECERRLLTAREPETSQVLLTNLERPDPIARLMAQTFIDGRRRWGGEYKEASEWLTGQIERMKRYPAGGPLTPDQIAQSLASDFHNHVANYIALRLLKEEPQNLPDWYVLGEIRYLQNQKLPSTTAALIGFCVETRNPGWRNAAAGALSRIPDPELRSNLEVERERARAQRREWPSALNVLWTR